MENFMCWYQGSAVTVDGRSSQKMNTLHEHRNNRFSWIGVMVPWITGILYSASIYRLFPEADKLEVSALRPMVVFAGLFAGGPAMFIIYQHWAGKLAAATIGLVNLAIAAALLLHEPVLLEFDPEAAIDTRWCYVLGGMGLIAATLWSFLWGLAASAEGDRRFLATYGESGASPSGAS